MKNKKNILPNEAIEILSEDSVTAIESALEQKIQLSVEAALTEQDELYASKLQQLISQIDKDHAGKLTRIVESIDVSHTRKLKNIVNHYENELNKSAGKFKTQLVESISNYLEEYINEAIPFEAIEEATKNNTATKVLENLRNVLAVDSTLMKESVKQAVVDGKTQIDSLQEKVSKLTKQNEQLIEAYTTTKSKLLIESKVAKMPARKAQYLRSILEDKTPEFIEENFEYTSRLFDKKENERIDNVRQDAFKKRKVKTDAPRRAPVINENTQPQQAAVNPYLEELQRMR